MNLDIEITSTINGFSAYVPGLPGCVAAAETFEETQLLINEAIVLHLEALMLRKSVVATIAVEARSDSALIWTTDNAPSLFVDIDAPASGFAVVTPKIAFGEAVAAA